MTGEAKVGIVDLYTVGVPVTDQDRALDFYTGKKTSPTPNISLLEGRM